MNGALFRMNSLQGKRNVTKMTDVTCPQPYLVLPAPWTEVALCSRKLHSGHSHPFRIGMASGLDFDQYHQNMGFLSELEENNNDPCKELDISLGYGSGDDASSRRDDSESGDSGFYSREDVTWGWPQWMASFIWRACNLFRIYIIAPGTNVVTGI